jgi:hypothetical protein
MQKKEHEMNIFVLDTDATVIPEHYCRLHVNKMLLETCQLLCNACEAAPYKRTHYNHPCSVWVRTSIQNFTWLEELGNALSAEFTKRTGKIHGCDKVLDWIANNTPDLPDTGQTDWPQCMPEAYRSTNTIASHRRYYASKLRDFRNRKII